MPHSDLHGSFTSDKEAVAAIDNVFYLQRDEEVKTFSEFQDKHIEKNDVKKKIWITTSTATLCSHFFTLAILGLLTWGLLWCIWGDGWRWDGEWFRLAAVAVIAWGSGQLLQELTTLPPLLAALLTGILARNLDILNMRDYTHIDVLLRKVYPVVILGKASLGWDVQYMKRNWRVVTSLGVLPWLAEVLTLAVCTHLLLDFPWLWGFLLGSIYASVSCAVVMPTVLRLGNTFPSTRNWPQLICTAGGTDTALSVGVYGLIYSFMFYESNDIYRYVKATVTLFMGVALGVAWGSLAKFAPHSCDYYVTELRVLFVLVGGLFANLYTSHFKWVGTGGVAVLACNATAATHWARSGWKLNNNPASTAYRVLWAALEPILFAYTGTFFVMNNDLSNTMVQGFGILVICLTMRLTITALVCWELSLKEKIFVCCTWIPKSIVEAVLCPLALVTLISRGNNEQDDMRYAEDLMRLIVQAILITTPVGFLLTKHLGPLLLRKTQKDTENSIST